MFQRAHSKQRHVEPARLLANELQPARSTAGKRALTDSLTPRGLAPPDRYKHAVETARRELNAVRSVAMPAYIAALRDKHLAPLAKQIELVNAAIGVRHLLMTANQQVVALEKAMTHRDPMVEFLRHDLTTLAIRAAKLGIYRGAEDMMPRAYEEATPRPPARREGALIKKTSNKTAHAPSPATGSRRRRPFRRPARASRVGRAATARPCARRRAGLSGPPGDSMRAEPASRVTECTRGLPPRRRPGCRTAGRSRGPRGGNRCPRGRRTSCRSTPSAAG